MFSEILKIIPRMDEKDIQKMVKALQSRFTKLAKGFGKGLIATLKGGGIAGIAMGLIDKLLNPLKEVQEAIDRTLKTSDDLATNAAQFNTTTGKLAKLVTLAKATGLDQDNLYTLITKFQTAVAEAKLNPNNPNVSAVKNYTGQTDMVEAFYGFINELNKMNANDRVLIQQQIFGEKQILKMADFLQQGSEGFAKLAKITGIDKVTSDTASRKINRNAGLADLQDALTSGREFGDMLNKSTVINEAMIRARDKAERVALERENRNIANYENLQAINTRMDQIMMLVEQAVNVLGSLFKILNPFVDKVIMAIDRLMKSPLIRGVKGWFGGGKED